MCLGHKVNAINTIAHGLRGLWDWIENHDRLSAMLISFALPLPILFAWTFFVYLLSIQNDLLRMVAIWSFLLTLFAVCGSRFD